MRTIKGPAIFLAQFLDARSPFRSLDEVCAWAASLGYLGVQMPTQRPDIFDLRRAAQSREYCSDVLEAVGRHGLVITELSTHLQGQLVATHPAYDELLNAFAPSSTHCDKAKRTAWATEELVAAAAASANLGLTTHATFSGSLAWPYFYPWPQRPDGLIDMAFVELARRWRPILDAFDAVGVDVCYEIHPGEDLHDGVTFELFLEKLDQHPRANILYDPSHLHLQGIQYLEYLDIYASRIKAFHVKDAELRPNGRSGVYGGYQAWIDRVGRFRSLGDGQIDFKAIFSTLARNDFPGWAVLEWECALEAPDEGARKGAAFIRDHIIHVTNRAFDDFASGSPDAPTLRRLLGLPLEGAAQW